MYWLPYSSHTCNHPSQTPCLPWIFYDTQKLIANSCKMVENSVKYSIRFCGIFFKFKQNFIAYRSSKVPSRPDFIFKIHYLWQSGFSRVHSNCCCSCSFESEIIEISQPFHKIYNNNILNFQESTAISNTCTKEVWKHIEGTTHIYIETIGKSGERGSGISVLPAWHDDIYIYIYIYIYIMKIEN